MSMWWHKLRCHAPTWVPVTEDERIHTCRTCGRTWKWAALAVGIGWARIL